MINEREFREWIRWIKKNSDKNERERPREWKEGRQCIVQAENVDRIKLLCRKKL